MKCGLCVEQFHEDENEGGIFTSIYSTKYTLKLPFASTRKADKSIINPIPFMFNLDNPKYRKCKIVTT